MRRHAGTLLMAAGMVLILAAIALAALNIREDTEGEKAASQALDELLLMMPTAVVTGAPTEDLALTDVPQTAMTMSQTPQITPTAEIYCQTGVPALQSNAQTAVFTAAPTGILTGDTQPSSTQIVDETLAPVVSGEPTSAETVQATDTLTTQVPMPDSCDAPVATEVPTITPEPVQETPAPTPTLAPAYIRNPYIEMPVVKIEGRYYIGVLELPVLGLSLPVQTTWSESMLKASPCRYKGSAYTGDMIISGHNYTKHFSGLKNLKPGDEVIFTDANGNVFRYYVLETVIMDGTEVKRMERGSDEWDLTLFTCTYGGASRLTVRCKEIK